MWPGIVPAIFFLQTLGNRKVDYTLLFVQVINGVQLGLLLFLVASGLTLVFGILDFVNLAHGSIYMIGAFICASLTFYLGNFLLAVLVALPLTGLVGYAIERVVARNLYDAPAVGGGPHLALGVLRI